MEDKNNLIFIIITIFECKEIDRNEMVWGLSYLTENADENLINQICQSQDLITCIINYLGSSNPEQYEPSLRAVGNILAGENTQNTNLILYHKGLEGISGLLTD